MKPLTEFTDVIGCVWKLYIGAEKLAKYGDGVGYNSSLVFGQICLLQSENVPIFDGLQILVVIQFVYFITLQRSALNIQLKMYIDGSYTYFK